MNVRRSEEAIDCTNAVMVATARAVQDSIGDRATRLDTLELLSRMDEAKHTPAYTGLYERFATLAADHVALAPFVAALGNLRI